MPMREISGGARADAPDGTTDRARGAPAFIPAPGGGEAARDGRVAGLGFGVRSLYAAVLHALRRPDGATPAADGPGRAAPPGAERAAFTGRPRTRGPADAHRVVYAGDFSPWGGAADFLVCAAEWADRNPDRRLELCWIGDGDLRGVLQAQALPDNLAQDFAGPLAPPAVAERFSRCGLFVVPTLAAARPAYLEEAMAAGLVVLGSRRNPLVRRLVSPGETGWLFDPFAPAQLLDALAAALGTAPERLDAMRAAAGGRVDALWGRGARHDPGHASGHDPAGSTAGGARAPAPRFG